MMPRPAYSEDDVVNAVFDVTENGLSQHKAARKHGVPQTTISDRLRGQRSIHEKTEGKPRLTKENEALLVSWILRQESVGYAPSPGQLRGCVTRLLHRQGETRPLGLNWVARFIKRHKDLKHKIGRRQEAVRFNAFTAKAVGWYFDIREGHYSWIKPEHTYNVDKGGIMAGYGMSLASK